MKAFVMLSCLATLAVCAPKDAHKHPHHESHRNVTAQTQPESVQQNKELIELQPLPSNPVSQRRLPSDLQRVYLPKLMHEEVHDQFGQYAFRFITADNTVVSERGHLVPSPSGGYVLEIEGKYQFIADDGQLYVTEYSGGPAGFHVEKHHMPVPVTISAI